MTQSPTTQEAGYLTAFQSLRENGSARDPSWLHALRDTAISTFSDLGFPVARRANEEWKYTDIRPIARTLFQPPAAPLSERVGGIDLKPLTLGQSGWSRLVFVDGSYAEELSSLSGLPAGVRVVNLAQALSSSVDLVQQHLARHAAYEANAFVALNTAFLHDGAFVHIPDGTLVEQPIHLLFITTAQQQDTVSHPRVLVVTGKESKATIIESYSSLSDGRYFTNGVTEVAVGPASAVTHYKLQQQSQQAYHVSNTQAVLARDSSFSSVNIDLGGRLVRNNLSLLMGAEGASCTLNGLYMVTGSQHVDNQVIIDHEKGYTTARELYKGILDGKSRSVFHGSIIVRQGAVKVDADQSDKNLLLSNEAEADTKPAFWIYCDDVRCTHGAACGQIDQAALFYLRSRGLSEQAARRLLTRGFVSEIIDSIENEPYRHHVDQLVQSTLREWLGDEEAA